MREPLCSLQRMSAIFLGNISGFVELLQDRLARSVELISFARCGTLSRTPECNGVGLVAVAGKLTMHHKPPPVDTRDLTVGEATGRSYRRHQLFFV